jgi:2-oxoglutarate dehydrogenase E2 component (dihydrolipoamide succinyltransferase)
MALVDLVMPKMGESIMEATILRWHKKPGDFVQQDETLMDIATDKVDSEVPSTTEGVLEEALFNENDVVPVGAVIARIRTGQEATVTTPTPPVSQPPAMPEPATESRKYPFICLHMMKPISSVLFTLVLNIAANEGISMTELRLPEPEMKACNQKDILIMYP